tara:strand:+ start:97 stop:327 length:231 start_codon:yes stop_codon:yes gene_type:complete
MGALADILLIPKPVNAHIIGWREPVAKVAGRENVMMHRGIGIHMSTVRQITRTIYTLATCPTWPVTRVLNILDVRK